MLHGIGNMVGYPLPYLRYSTPPRILYPWWLLLETCLNLFTWGPTPSPQWYWHLVVATKTDTFGKRAVRILLECCLMILFYFVLRKAWNINDVFDCIWFNSVSARKSISLFCYILISMYCGKHKFVFYWKKQILRKDKNSEVFLAQTSSCFLFNFHIIWKVFFFVGGNISLKCC